MMSHPVFSSDGILSYNNWSSGSYDNSLPTIVVVVGGGGGDDDDDDPLTTTTTTTSSVCNGDGKTVEHSWNSNDARQSQRKR